MNYPPQGDWSTLAGLWQWLLTPWLGRVNSESSQRTGRFTVPPEKLAPTMHDDGINWTEILLWVLSGLGTLLAFAFKAKLDGKMDKDAVGKLIDDAIGRYHDRTFKEFQAEMLRMHQQNLERLRELDTTIRDLIVRLSGRGDIH